VKPHWTEQDRWAVHLARRRQQIKAAAMPAKEGVSDVHQGKRFEPDLDGPADAAATRKCAVLRS
jgi:hypothetical protein